MHELKSIAFVLGLALLFCICYAATNSVDCSRSQACYPWDLGIGPYCGRGNKINLRFTVDLAPENYYKAYNTTPPTVMTTASYGFCPVVDELQAFNLSAAPILAGMQLDNTTSHTNVTSSRFSLNMTEAYVYAYGFGGIDSVLFPNSSTSTGAVQIAANLSSCNGILLTTFLVLAVTLDKGKFKYTSDQLNPLGSQFQSTCTGGVCSMDSKQKCIGNGLTSNCAKCFTNPADLANATVQIWVSYYGTDTTGRTLLSGSNNPLNFQQFSQSGVWNNLQTSFGNLQNGQIINDQQLGPSNVGG